MHSISFVISDSLRSCSIPSIESIDCTMGAWDYSNSPFYLTFGSVRFHLWNLTDDQNKKCMLTFLRNKINYHPDAIAHHMRWMRQRIHIRTALNALQIARAQIATTRLWSMRTSSLSPNSKPVHSADDGEGDQRLVRFHHESRIAAIDKRLPAA